MSDAPYAIDLLGITDTKLGSGLPGRVRNMEKSVPPARASQDLDLIARLRKGERAAVESFLSDMSEAIWTACRLFAGIDEEGRRVFEEIVDALSKNRFARLARYNGRSTLRTYTLLVVRELLSERVVGFLVTDRERTWPAFEKLFKTDIQRLVSKRIPSPSDEEQRSDAYQTICLALIDDDYRRLRAYDGSGSFGGFVLNIVDRLLIDLLRKHRARRRLPAAIANASPLDQSVFKLVYWKGLPPEPLLLLPYVDAPLGETADASTVSAALERVRVHARAEGGWPALVPMPGSPDEDFVDADMPTPEDNIIRDEDERTLAAAVAAMKKAIDTFTPHEQLYFTVALAGSATPPSREIARLMRCSVEDIYKLKQNVLKRLRNAVADDSAIKNWRASV